MKTDVKDSKDIVRCIEIVNSLQNKSIFVQIQCNSIDNQNDKHMMTKNIDYSSLNTCLDETKDESHDQQTTNKQINQQTTSETESGNNCNNFNYLNPGFVIIAPLESYSIPIIVNNHYDLPLITVYVENVITNEPICVSNQFPINRDFIEINESPKSKKIIIILQNNSKFETEIDTLFSEWCLPPYLRNAMKNNGWSCISMCSEITNQDLIEMGFKKGHRMKFFHNYYTMINHIVYKIFKLWQLPLYLCSQIIDQGWSDPNHWNKITDQQLINMTFNDGHIVKFKKNIDQLSYISD
eukprot:95990_1